MPPSATPSRHAPSQDASAFGWLRLLLASLVIVSHTPELTDGDRHRELLTRLFGSLSFGELAVDGFFIISGFLMAGSVSASASPRAFLRKRLARLYPGFAVASIVCVALVAPLAGAWPNDLITMIPGTVLKISILAPPDAPHVFAGTPYAGLNGAAWTLQYELGCYLLILWLARAGLLASRRLFCLALTSLALYVFLTEFSPDREASLPISGFLFGGPAASFARFIGLFIAGAAFRRSGRPMRLTPAGTGLALAGLCLGMMMPPLAHVAVAIFGAPLLFGAATLAVDSRFTRFVERHDISYGLYLYAWPVGKLVGWWGLSDDLVVIGLLTWAGAALAGAASWLLVEAPVMRRLRSGSKAASPALAPAGLLRPIA